MSDWGSIEQLARIEDQAEHLRAALDIGAVLVKPVVSPKGEVVGEERYANPAFKELARLYAAMLPLRDRLGLSPLARARLGLAVIDLQKNSDVFTQLLAKREAGRRERGAHAA